MFSTVQASIYGDLRRRIGYECIRVALGKAAVGEVVDLWLIAPWRRDRS